MALVASPPPPPHTATNTDFIRFPPWPSPPPGVTLIPFSDWAKKEVGIKLTCPNPDGIEVDGLDIPTVALEHPHATDKCKTDAFREDGEDAPKAKRRKIKTSAMNGDLKREWWQIWADEEAGKFTGHYNPKTPAIDRLCQAATDFRASRTWPPGEPRQLSPTNLFNQFGVFIGLQAIIPTWIRAERRKAEEALKGFKDMVERSGQNGTQDDDDESESDEGDHLSAAAPVGLQNGKHDDDQIAVDPPRTQEDEAEAAAIQEEIERKDDRLWAFLNDPETVVKMFLSSYMRKEGLVWADSNLSITPRLLFFFLRYILRNKLLPEYEAGLKKALAVVECAQVELPRTSEVAKIIPCEVSLALRDQYGSKAAQFKPIIIEDEEQEIGKLSNGNIDLDGLDDGPWGDGNVDDENDPALEEPTVEYVGDGEYVDGEEPIDEEGIANIEEVGDETEPIENDTVQADTGYNGWNDNGWSDVPMDVDSGTGGVWDSQGTWNDASKFQFDDTPAIDWTSPAYSLKNFLGIDTLPESYATGVVEESVRKIVSLHAPTGSATTDGALEGEFESKLGRIVLAPWNDWDVPKEAKGLDEMRRVYSEIYRGRRISKGIRRSHPKNGEEEAEEDIKTLNPEELYEDGREYSESANARIVWESSKGWVVDPDSTNLLFSNCTAEKPAPAELGSNNVHDPSKDTVQLLVDPAVVDKLKDVVGLGLGGTFVQLVRDHGTPTRYWYSDKLALVIPSFYVA